MSVNKNVISERHKKVNKSRETVHQGWTSP